MGTGIPFHKISATSGNLLIGVNTEVIKIEDKKEKKKVKRIVSEIAVRLLLSVVRRFPNDAIEAFHAIKDTLATLTAQRSYDQNDMAEFLDFDEVLKMIKSISGENAASEIIAIKPTGSPCLIWTQRVNIGVLSNELKGRKWIKSEREFWKLFDEDCEEGQVRWDMKYKWHLGYLLLRLKADDFIRTGTTKGHYKLAQDRIVGFKGEVLAKDDLKRLASKVKKDAKKYNDIVSPVEEIMKTIMKKMNTNRDD